MGNHEVINIILQMFCVPFCVKLAIEVTVSSDLGKHLTVYKRTPATMVLNTGLYSVKAFLLLDGDGNRLIAKYYDCPEFNTVKDQKYFEKSIFEKSKKSSSTFIIWPQLYT